MQNLYREAVPGLELTGLEELAEEANMEEDSPPIYLQHWRDADTQEEIIEDVVTGYGIERDYDVFQAKKAVFLGAGPSTSLETVDHAREDYGMEPVSNMLDGELEEGVPE